MRMEWREYVPVGQRKAKARRRALQLAEKRGFPTQPIENLGRNITKTFWGNSWCENLESYSDFSNRLPRGRTYARNGSIADLVISKGQVKAIVGGSDVYEIEIEFSLLKKKKWNAIKDRCAGAIDSVISLLQGRFDESVMSNLSRQKDGLFPSPREIEFRCDCPDWAYMCKHVAAVLYGVGARLDCEPEMLFLLRGVDHLELVTSQAGVDSLVEGPADSALDSQDLSQIFGIEFDDGIAEVESAAPVGIETKTTPKKMPTAKKKKAKKKLTKSKVSTAVKQKAPRKKAERATSKKRVTKKRVTKKKVTAVASKAVKKKSTKKPSLKKSTRNVKKKAKKKK